MASLFCSITVRKRFYSYESKISTNAKSDIKKILIGSYIIPTLATTAEIALTIVLLNQLPLPLRPKNIKMCKL